MVMRMVSIVEDIVASNVLVILIQNDFYLTNSSILQSFDIKFIMVPWKFFLQIVCATNKSWSRITNNDPGKLCIFPFKYKGVTYNECTNVDNEIIGANIFWCATKVDEDGELAADSRHWGECNEYCRTTGLCYQFTKVFSFLKSMNIYFKTHPQFQIVLDRSMRAILTCCMSRCCQIFRKKVR